MQNVKCEIRQKKRRKYVKHEHDTKFVCPLVI